MSLQEFCKLSTSTSVAAAAAMVLIVTSFVAWFIGESGMVRAYVGAFVAVSVVALAMAISPPNSGFWGLVFLGLAHSSLLYASAFLTSKVSVMRGAQAHAALAKGRFWEPW